MSQRTRISIALYRGILRWSKHNADVPFHVRTSDLSELIPQLSAVNLNLSDSSASVAKIAKYAFTEGKNLEGYAIEDAVDRGFTALRMLNTSYASLLESMRQIRSDRSNREGIKHTVGTVFKHAKYGYTGVVYGWDRTCERDGDWVQQMNAKPDQPYYYVLPDENDCQRLFGGVRLTKYVGEENIVPITDNARIVHRALDNYFTGYSAEHGRYIPVKSLQFQYPETEELGEVEELAVTPVSEDSNLLLHEEPEIQTAALH